MKTLLRLKQADLLLQALALLIPAVGCSFFPVFDCILLAYTIVGVVQLLSCLANKLMPPTFRSSARRNYERAVGILIILVLVTIFLFLYMAWFTVLVLVVFSPALAIFYALLTYNELRTIKQYTYPKIYSNLINE